MKRGGPLRRSTPLQAKAGLGRRTKLQGVSQKRKAIEQPRRVLVDLVLSRDGFTCRARTLLPGRCGGPLDVHEVLSRARGGSILDPDNCLTLCRLHHDWVTTHPAEAEAGGWSRSTGVDDVDQEERILPPMTATATACTFHGSLPASHYVKPKPLPDNVTPIWKANLPAGLDNRAAVPVCSGCAARLADRWKVTPIEAAEVATEER